MEIICSVNISIFSKISYLYKTNLQETGMHDTDSRVTTKKFVYMFSLHQKLILTAQRT